LKVEFGLQGEQGKQVEDYLENLQPSTRENLQPFIKHTNNLAGTLKR